MAKVSKIQEVSVSQLKPYEKNTKIHGEEQIQKLCKSIQEFGFISPILIDSEMNVIAGHGRLMAAKQLKMKKVPCLFVEGLTEAQRRAYIIADNRLGEYSEWNLELVAAEIGELNLEAADLDFLEFQFDEPGDEEEPEDGETGEEAEEKAKAWSTRDARCDMKLNITARIKNGRWYTALYAVSKEGQTLEEIKNDKKREKQAAGDLVDYIRKAAKQLGIPFYEEAISCGNANRLKPKLTIQRRPEERNLILFDDIITTGTTVNKTAELLEGEGYTVITIIGIRNQ